MAYSTGNLAKLEALKALAERIKDDYATKESVTTLTGRVDDLFAVGAEANVVTGVQVNGTDLPVNDKKVNVAVPEYSMAKAANSGDYAAVYNLTKDGTNTGVEINIPKDMVVQSGSVVTNPEGQTAGTYIKLVLANADSDELFINVSGLIEYVTSGSASGDTVFITVDEATHKVKATITDGAIAAEKLAAELQATLASVADKVDKVSGKGLSANDYTTAEKEKLAGVAAGATKVEVSATNGKVKVNGSEITVYTEPSDVVHGTVATAAEVTEMLSEVFGGSGA